MDQLISMSLEGLRGKWLEVIKGRYDAHVVDVDKRRKKHFKQWERLKDKSEKNGHRNKIKVDYRKDEYKIHCTNVISCLPSVVSIDSSIAQYAFWLQYEHARTDNAAARALRKDGWYERRVSWLVDLLDVMGVSAESVAEQMREGGGITRPEMEVLGRNPDLDYDFLVKARGSKPRIKGWG